MRCVAMARLEVDGHYVATLVSEGLGGPRLGDVVRVNVADGYEKDSTVWRRLSGTCWVRASTAADGPALSSYVSDLARPRPPHGVGKAAVLRRDGATGAISACLAPAAMTASGQCACLFAAAVEERPIDVVVMNDDGRTVASKHACATTAPAFARPPSTPAT